MSKLKTRLEYNNKNNKYIESLKKVYLIGHWARYGVLELPYAGKMVEDDLFGITPLVYDLDDHNGTYAEYILTKINDVTTGDTIIYTFNRNLAQALSDKLNEYKSCQVTNYMQNSIETLQEENKRVNTVLNLVKQENQELKKLLDNTEFRYENLHNLYYKDTEQLKQKVIVPKFDVGQEVWVNDWTGQLRIGRIYEVQVNAVLHDQQLLITYLVDFYGNYEDDDQENDYYEEKDVFATREEAEKKLAEIGEKDE